MKKILLLLLIVFPVISSAESMPDFPMAFWGVVTIDGSPAPAGTVVSIYGDDQEMVGRVTVKEPGVYGYSDPTKQKLLVAEAEGPLEFAVTSAAVSGGQETKGLSLNSYPNFESGKTVEKDLNFITQSAESSETNSGGSSGGSRSSGGGGGSSSKSKEDETEGEVLGAATSSIGAEKRIELQKQIIALLTQLISLLKLKIEMM